ncbi:hypothetical protein [Chitinimonas lacunae]|uniref:Uncharacterized protein n=1 Tax=Chitinimonas lacunae TaxID=1963018 RepID=A0ABV8MKK0_9NEIS
MDLATWNSSDLWQKYYKELVDRHIFFAEDAFGFQFSIRHERISTRKSKKSKERRLGLPILHFSLFFLPASASLLTAKETGIRQMRWQSRQEEDVLPSGVVEAIFVKSPSRKNKQLGRRQNVWQIYAWHHPEKQSKILN